MTWRTSQGVRTLKGAEAALIREALGDVAEIVEDEFDGEEPWEFGTRQFDQQEPLVKLALLAEVGSALLRDTETVPELTAVNEATVAILFDHIQQSVEFEIDCERDMEAPFFWRTLVLAASHEMGDTSELELPTSDCRAVDEWSLSVESLADRILWDRDFEIVDDIADLPPEQSAAVRSSARIGGEYAAALPPSPRDDDLPRIRAVIKELCEP